ncbi:MAG: ATP-binding protein [Phycisphaerae bacterium]|jgi:two-component system heavy metal sensor histidine kinase CusS
MRPLTLKGRLSGLMALALALVITAFAIIVYQETKELFRKQADQSLTAMAGATDEVLRDSDASQWPAELSSLLPPGRHADILVRIWKDDADQAVYTSPRAAVDWKAAIASLPKPREGQSRFFSTSLGGQSYRGIWWRTASDRSINIMIAQTAKDFESELRELLGDLMWIGAAVIAAMVVVVILLVRIGLRPIHGAACQLVHIDAHNLADVAMAPQNVPGELTPFVESLRQMLNRLDEALRRQKAFIADASHELRTPVAVAKSTIQTTLAESRSADQYRQSLQETLEDLRRMEHLVDELLLLARLDEAADASPGQPVQLDHLLVELADSFSPPVAQSGGRLMCSISPAAVAGDYGQLARLFSNLLDNAWRHGPKGGTIYLTAEVQTDQVVVTVKDDGGHIPPEALSRLFERFFRVDGSRASSTGGAGLGLAIARQIVLRHGGTIQITSQPASGTQVLVTLPLTHIQDEAE